MSVIIEYVLTISARVNPETPTNSVRGVLYFEVVKYTIEKIYDADNVYNVKDYTEEELDEFLATLDVSSFKEVQKFLETMPKLKYETSYTNSLGNEKKVVLQNLNDFFMLG